MNSTTKKIAAAVCSVFLAIPAWSKDLGALQTLKNAAASYGISEEAKSSAPKPVLAGFVESSPDIAPPLPARFTIRERFFSLTDAFDLKSGDQKLGTLTEKFFSLTKSFRYTDSSGRCAAKARARFFSWGTRIDVADCQGHKIGSIKENVLKSLLKVYTVYSILDAHGREIAKSRKTEWISTDVVLRRENGGLIAKLHRPWLNLLADKWTVSVQDPSALDSRLIVMIAAYKTSVDNDRRRENLNRASRK
jgi:uncharacterized protein YxjI